ncbi:hypothetical protein RB213_009756 [Colletotrichum asianum]
MPDRREDSLPTSTSSSPSALLLRTTMNTPTGNLFGRWVKLQYQAGCVCTYDACLGAEPTIALANQCESPCSRTALCIAICNLSAELEQENKPSSGFKLSCQIGIRVHRRTEAGAGMARKW